MVTPGFYRGRDSRRERRYDAIETLFCGKLIAAEALTEICRDASKSVSPGVRFPAPARS